MPQAQLRIQPHGGGVTAWGFASVRVRTGWRGGHGGASCGRRTSRDIEAHLILDTAPQHLILFEFAQNLFDLHVAVELGRVAVVEHEGKDLDFHMIGGIALFQCAAPSDQARESLSSVNRHRDENAIRRREGRRRRYVLSGRLGHSEEWPKPVPPRRGVG